MRDPARIDQILELLRKAWQRSPNLRFGQLIVNAVRPLKPCPEIFSIEDSKLARHLERMTSGSDEVPGDAAGNQDAKPPRYTHRQGQFLAFIHAYRRLNGQSPAETDMVRHFRVTPPSVHSMIVKLHELGLITREPGVARSIQVAISEEEIPPLENRVQS